MGDNWVIAGVVAAFLAFGLNLVIQIRGGAWNTSKRETDLKDSLKASVDSLRSETTQNLAEINRDMNENFRVVADRFGETVSALREKVHINELEAVRLFVEKKDFDRQIDITMETVKAIDGKINARADHQDTKIAQIREIALRSRDIGDTRG